LRRIDRSAQAGHDITQALNHYIDQDVAQLPERFLAELDAAFRHIAQHPGTGSPRYAGQRTAKGLRCWLLRRFPYAVFYLVSDERISVIRVLHQASNIPKHLNKNNT
jgi:toxin ParE1/3/4